MTVVIVSATGVKLVPPHSHSPRLTEAALLGERQGSFFFYLPW